MVSTQPHSATTAEHSQPKRGRPSVYCAEIAMTICDRLADGESIRAICAGAGMPDKATVFRWLTSHEEFRTWYAFAREARMDELLHEAIEIADACAKDFGNIAVASLRINARFSTGGRTASKKYGRNPHAT